MTTGKAAWINASAPAALLTAILALGTAPGSRAEQSCIEQLGLPAPQNQALPERFRILSWNIQKAGNRGWDADLASLADNVELVFLQEASLQAGIPDLLEEVPAETFAPGYRTSSLDTGVMTLSAATPSAACQLAALEPWLGTPKATSITEHPITGRDMRLLAINLHAINFALGLEDFEQQFSQLGAVLEQHTGPVIVAGDLNTWSESRQASVDEFMRDHGLVAVSFQPDLRSRALGRALDHVYLRGMQVEAAKVIPVSTSDHNPLRVELALD